LAAIPQSEIIDHVIGFDFKRCPVAIVILNQKIGEIFSHGMADRIDGADEEIRLSVD